MSAGEGDCIVVAQSYLEQEPCREWAYHMCQKYGITHDFIFLLSIYKSMKIQIAARTSDTAP